MVFLPLITKNHGIYSGFVPVLSKNTDVYAFFTMFQDVVSICKEVFS